MSELKTYNSERIYWAVEQVEQVAGDIDDLHLDDTLFYIKSEVDKATAKLKEKHNTEVKELLCLIRDKENNFNRAFNSEEKEIRHQKYKRCLDKANYWLVISYHCIDDKHKQRAERRHYKWLELTKQFKEINNGTH